MPGFHEQHFHFDWSEAKAAINFSKHGVSFELASSVFNDPRILTVADTEHSESEERWFSVGLASNGTMLSIAYLWAEPEPGVEPEPGLVKIRLITARRATAQEIRSYGESQ